jgi:CDP-glucose 4,6-dehydratase
VNHTGIERVKSLDGPLLVTGHTGFKGAWLKLLLERLNIYQIGLSLKPEDDSLFIKLDFQSRKDDEIGDINDFESCLRLFSKYKPSAVIHLAAQPLVLESFKNPVYTFQTNVLGTANILECARRTSSVKAVLVSTTDKVYENLNDSKRFRESDNLKGKDPYSASKVATESVINAWRNISKIESGPNISAARAGNVIGGGDFANDRLIPDLVRGYMKGEEVLIRNSESSRPWQHVLDPISGYLKLLDALLDNNDVPAMNFGPKGSNLSVGEVVSIFSNESSFKPKVIYQKRTSSDPLESETLFLDASFSERSLSWTPNWSQENAVTSTARWWDNVLNKGMSAREACLLDVEQLLLANTMHP